MLVSIALAVYNGEKYLHFLLDSLAQQTYTNIELIILDDCSTDKSAEIITNFKPQFDVFYYKNDFNLGVVESFKKIISYCNGDYIAFCDQDDIWISNKIEKGVNLMIQNEDSQIPTAVFSDLSLIDINNNVTANSFMKLHKIIPEKLMFNRVLFDNVITGCTLLINKKMASEIKVMPTNILMHDYWVALIAYSFGQYHFIDEPLVAYRSHSQSVTTKNKKTIFDLIIFFLTNGKNELKQKFLQADLFLAMYRYKLNGQHKKDIELFLNYKNKGLVFQLLYKHVTKFKQFQLKYNR